ncbi:MAG: 4Fe-4S binding protein [Eubacteriales bacterium]
MKERIRNNYRHMVQVIVTAVTNGYVLGFTKGKIYQGDLKRICVPGLNCYSCPGALGSCPMGALQSMLGGRGSKFSFYVVGFFLIFGAFFGRFICGWLCPFGFLQDLLHKIPFVNKVKNLPGHTYLKYLKYVILLVFVIVLPIVVVDLVGQGSPWFCKYICPSGTLTGGWTLTLLNPSIRANVGILFTWKSAILILILILSIWCYRPFCQYICPLGAIYGFFNPIALYRYEIVEKDCIHCKKCEQVCPVSIPVYKNPNSMECIRCGACKRECPTKAIVNQKA